MSEETKEEVVSETNEAEVTSENQPNEFPAEDGTATLEQPSPYNGFWAKVDKFFGISKSGSKFKVEIVAGLTTFMAMVYILLVNPGIFTTQLETEAGSGEYFSIIPGLSFGAMYIATALGAIVGTLLIAFLARIPL